MKELLLIAAIFAVVAGGFFVMDRVDRLLSSSFPSEPPSFRRMNPSGMLLTDRLSDEEIIRSIRRFASEHGRVSIILQDEPPCPDLPAASAAAGQDASNVV